MTVCSTSMSDDFDVGTLCVPISIYYNYVASVFDKVIFIEIMLYLYTILLYMWCCTSGDDRYTSVNVKFNCFYFSVHRHVYHYSLNTLPDGSCGNLLSMYSTYILYLIIWCDILAWLTVHMSVSYMSILNIAYIYIIYI